MTVQDLQNLYWLQKETNTLLLEIQQAESQAKRITTAMSSDRVKTSRSLKSWEDCVINLTQLKDKLQDRMTECVNLYNSTLDWVNGINDSYVRQVILLRYVSGLTWDQVAAKIGGGNSADGCRKAASRYVARHCD